MSRARLFTCFIGLISLWAACSPVKHVALPDAPVEAWTAIEDFEEVLQALANNSKGLTTMKGKARIQLSEPGRSERVVVDFVSSRDRSMLILKNNLGIEGTRLLAEGDSVLAYNKIERTLIKMHRDTYARVYLNGYIPLNLIDLLFPSFNLDELVGAYENDQRLLLRDRSGTEFFFTKPGLHLSGIIYQEQSFTDLSIVKLGEHTTINGFTMPRRLQIQSADGQSNMYLLVVDLSLNAGDLSFDLDIPKGLPVTRL